jgi:predicted RNA-binding Zn ribbon-like protein
MRQLEIRKEEAGFGWAWGGPAQALDRPLWPIARSAAELLTSDDLGCIRECASETCSWLFMDCSRNQRRRWCDMSTCGNRAKARRHYRRRQKARV